MCLMRSLRDLKLFGAGLCLTTAKGFPVKSDKGDVSVIMIRTSAEHDSVSVTIILLTCHPLVWQSSRLSRSFVMFSMEFYKQFGLSAEEVEQSIEEVVEMLYYFGGF